MTENEYAVAGEIYGLYYPQNVHAEKRILFLLREPGNLYNPKDPNSNLAWWNEVCKGNASPRYSRRIRIWISYITDESIPPKLQDVEFAKLYYANLFPWGGGGSRSEGYKAYVEKTKKKERKTLTSVIKTLDSDADLSLYKGWGEGYTYNETAEARAKKIIEEVKPNYIFTCYDIYDLLEEKSISEELERSEIKGIAYGEKIKRYSKRIFEGKEVDVYEVLHPSRYEPNVPRCNAIV